MTIMGKGLGSDSTFSELGASRVVMKVLYYIILSRMSFSDEEL